MHRKLCDRCRLRFVRVTALGKPPRCQARAPGSPPPWPQRRPDLGSLSWCWQGDKASRFLETFPHPFLEMTLNLTESQSTEGPRNCWPSADQIRGRVLPLGLILPGGVLGREGVSQVTSTLGSDEKATVPTKSPFLPLLSEGWAQ